MADAYIIHVAGNTAGIVVRNRSGETFSFFAATHTFNALEGRSFKEPIAAERAARKLATYGNLPRECDAGPHRDQIGARESIGDGL